MTTEEEWGLSLRRAFVDGGADYIVIYSRRQVFLLNAAEYGVRMGWLYRVEVELDSQSTEWRYRLTDAGKEQVRNANSFVLAGTHE